MRNGTGVEILLVEDNPRDAELTLRALQKRNFANNIVHVKDGQEAIDWLFCTGAYAERDVSQHPARMDSPITIEERRRHLVRRVGIAAVALAAIAFLFAASIEWLRPSIARRSLITARVTRGGIDASVDAIGTIVPLVDQVVSCCSRSTTRRRSSMRCGSPIAWRSARASRCWSVRGRSEVCERRPVRGPAVAALDLLARVDRAGAIPIPPTLSSRFAFRAGGLPRR